VPGSLAGTALASTISGGYILDDLQVSFILQATQAHKDSKNLNAPKVTVLSGESAGIRVETEKSYVSDYEFEENTTTGDNPIITSIADPEISIIRDGVVLNVTPTITSDKKYVLLRIMTSYTETNFETYNIPDTETGDFYPIDLPISQIADVRTRVTVPDGGTLLIGGQKLTGEMNSEEGVPVLSKLPVLGRLFENRGKVKDNSILLILVKPTIILQDEQERDAVAAMESQF
jgi:type II secretory pathway component GspD/PulD (secretin)